MSEEQIASIFKKLWDPYYAQNPQVPIIYRLLTEREGSSLLYNDHIALRTFQHPRVGVEVLAKTFMAIGFEERDTIELPEKHVTAKFYTHPSGEWPRVFISELILASLSAEARTLVEGLIEQVPQALLDKNSLCFSGRPWGISHEDYERLLKESEYAAWLSAHGYQMNHATVSVNRMKTFDSLEEVRDFLKGHNFELNGQADGHEIQSAKDAEGRVILKQSSTLASQVTTEFNDGSYVTPACYYEFLQRFYDYDGFDPGNAAKIMESTDAK